MAAVSDVEKQELSETIRKLFPSATRDHHLDTLVAEKSLPANLRQRL